jgi:hypothetical protein
VSKNVNAPIAIIKCASRGAALGDDWNPDQPSGFKLYPLGESKEAFYFVDVVSLLRRWLTSHQSRMSLGMSSLVCPRAMRMVFQLVGGRQLWRGKGVDREYLLAKLQEFHRQHKTPLDQAIGDLHEAFAWLPKSAYAEEAQPLRQLMRTQRRGPQRIGDLMIPLLIRLGITGQELGVPEAETVESTASEARGSG